MDAAINDCLIEEASEVITTLKPPLLHITF